jgi:hypothetical protein
LAFAFALNEELKAAVRTGGITVEDLRARLASSAGAATGDKIRTYKIATDKATQRSILIAPVATRTIEPAEMGPGIHLAENPNGRGFIISEPVEPSESRGAAPPPRAARPVSPPYVEPPRYNPISIDAQRIIRRGKPDFAMVDLIFDRDDYDYGGTVSFQRVATEPGYAPGLIRARWPQFAGQIQMMGSERDDKIRIIVAIPTPVLEQLNFLEGVPDAKVRQLCWYNHRLD